MLPPKLITKIIVINSAEQVLLVRRSKTAPRRALTWEFPGGIIEEDEDPKAAAIRELGEEAGIFIQDASYLFAGNAPDNFYAGIFFYVLVEKPKVELSYEHDKYQWTSLDKALELIEVAGYKKALKHYKDYILNGYEVVVSAKCLLEHDGRYLLLKRSAKEELGPGLWDLPGGQLEPGETVYQSMTRELNEETGIVASGLSILFAHTEINNQTIRIRIGLSAKANHNNVSISSEHSEYLWAPKGQTYQISEHPKWPGWGEFVKIFG